MPRHARVLGRSGGAGAPTTIREHQAVAFYPPGLVIPNLALQGPFGVEAAQPMTDQFVGECIAQEEWHGPEVESEIPMVLQVLTCVVSI